MYLELLFRLAASAADQALGLFSWDAGALLVHDEWTEGDTLSCTAAQCTRLAYGIPVVLSSVGSRTARTARQPLPAGVARFFLMLPFLRL
jgi:hypothetical protein